MKVFSYAGRRDHIGRKKQSSFLRRESGFSWTKQVTQSESSNTSKVSFINSNETNPYMISVINENVLEIIFLRKNVYDKKMQLVTCGPADLISMSFFETLAFDRDSKYHLLPKNIPNSLEQYLGEYGNFIHRLMNTPLIPGIFADRLITIPQNMQEVLDILCNEFNIPLHLRADAKRLGI